MSFSPVRAECPPQAHSSLRQLFHVPGAQVDPSTIVVSREGAIRRFTPVNHGEHQKIDDSLRGGSTTCTSRQKRAAIGGVPVRDECPNYTSEASSASDSSAASTPTATRSFAWIHSSASTKPPARTTAPPGPGAWPPLLLARLALGALLPTVVRGSAYDGGAGERTTSHEHRSASSRSVGSSVCRLWESIEMLHPGEPDTHL
jgi:hypothetical protein